MTEAARSGPWKCPNCSEPIEEQFDPCRKCGADAPGDVSRGDRGLQRQVRHVLLAASISAILVAYHFGGKSHPGALGEILFYASYAGAVLGSGIACLLGVMSLHRWGHAVLRQPLMWVALLLAIPSACYCVLIFAIVAIHYVIYGALK